eukprot:5544980-Pyramimonas_sp.AAC.1
MPLKISGSKWPSGSYLQVATTYARIPIKLWRCTCQTAGEPAQLAERELDWHDRGVQKGATKYWLS